MKFELTIEMEGVAMASEDNVAEALGKVAGHLRQYGKVEGKIFDGNGNSCGGFFFSYGDD